VRTAAPQGVPNADNGRPLAALAMRSRFDKARKAAGVTFQFRDIRAKTASDTGDLAIRSACWDTRTGT
jgi:hypothetical protein